MPSCYNREKAPDLHRIYYRIALLLMSNEKNPPITVESMDRTLDRQIEAVFWGIGESLSCLLR